MDINNTENISGEVKYEIIGIVLIVFSLFASLVLLEVDTGFIGIAMHTFLGYFLGKAAFLFPLFLFILGSRYLYFRKEIKYTLRFWLILIIVACFLLFFHNYTLPVDASVFTAESIFRGSGVIIATILYVLRKSLGYYGTIVANTALLLICIVAVLNFSLVDGFLKVFKKLKNKRRFLKLKKQQKDFLENNTKPIFFDNEKDLFALPWDLKRELQKTTISQDEITEKDQEQNVLNNNLCNSEKKVEVKKDFAEISQWLAFSPKIEETTVLEEETVVNDKTLLKPITMYDDINALRKIQSEKNKIEPETKNSSKNFLYKLPSLSLLHKAKNVDEQKLKASVAEKGKVLEETLKSFGVKATIVGATVGPTVTRYEIEPAAGVKVNKIVGLVDDIALKLATFGVRIEAPIPGRAAIGIEVPNTDVASVALLSVLNCKNFLESESSLVVGLGKDITDKPVIVDLGKMPHLLVAGSTGSGKSVCINALIASILFKATPEEVKLILIDPKMVELSNYNGIPHLLTPVVVEPEKAATALRWAVQEMERRYSLFANVGARNIARYNKIDNVEQLPYIVIIIDELADLMMVAPTEVEDAICRLAQKARAAGLHLVLATQRPSVDVITGIIKANIPSRIAFAVSSQIDSRTILDTGGAEKLLGRGDMLFAPIGVSKPFRVQGAFITDEEVEAVIEHVKLQAQPKYDEEVTLEKEGIQENSENGKGKDEQDELFEAVIELLMETGQASTSMLQRKFRIGYNRAARIMDYLEEMKIIGVSNGSKAREMLMTKEDMEKNFLKNNLGE